jgi:hypothetical protein
LYPANTAEEYASRPSEREEAHQIIQGVIDGLRDWESRFYNVDIMYLHSYVNDYPFDSTGRRSDTLILEETTLVHLVRQDEYSFASYFSVGRSGKGSFTNRILIASDSQVTYLLRHSTGRSGNGYLANIILEAGRRPSIPFARLPHSLLRGDSETPESEDLAAQLRGETRSPTSQLELTYEGIEEVDGISCVKLCSRVRNSKEPERSNETYLWYARDYSYMLVKSVFLWRMKDERYPDCVEQVSDWRKLPEGVVIPFEARRTRYMMKPTNEPVASGVDTIRILRCSLSPNYPKEFFTIGEIPKGTVVYMVKGDDIFRTYVQGDDVLPVWQTVLIGAAVLVLAIMVAWKARGLLVGRNGAMT